MKIAIVCDWLTNFGGAEKVVLKLHEIFPEAPIYTSVYDKNKMQKYFDGICIKTSFIQKLPFGVKLYRQYLPLMPLAFEQFDFSKYDLVISSSSCCAKGINVHSNTIHICYCHTPMRYAWDLYNSYNNKKNPISKYIIAKIMHKMRIWDFVSSNRVDYFIANSYNVANRIKKHYRRDAKVIYPPIDDIFYKRSNNNKSDYYLLISRFVKYKKIDIIVEAFNELNLPLCIIGKGPEKEKIKKMAKSNIIFKEDLAESQLKEMINNSKSFVFMAEEDFGMAMAEAQAAGKPVIAFYKGGASEIISKNTGILIKNQTKQDLVKAVKKMEIEYNQFDSEKIMENAKKFKEENFKNEIKNFINETEKNNGANVFDYNTND